MVIGAIAKGVGKALLTPRKSAKEGQGQRETVLSAVINPLEEVVKKRLRKKKKAGGITAKRSV